MKLTAHELMLLTCDTEGFTTRIRRSVGLALCNVIYPKVTGPERCPELYTRLTDFEFYMEPTDEEILFCIDYIQFEMKADIDTLELTVKIEP